MKSKFLNAAKFLVIFSLLCSLEVHAVSANLQKNHLLRQLQSHKIHQTHKTRGPQDLKLEFKFTLGVDFFCGDGATSKLGEIGIDTEWTHAKKNGAKTELEKKSAGLEFTLTGTRKEKKAPSIFDSESLKEQFENYKNKLTGRRNAIAVQNQFTDFGLSEQDKSWKWNYSVTKTIPSFKDIIDMLMKNLIKYIIKELLKMFLKEAAVAAVAAAVPMAGWAVLAFKILDWIINSGFKVSAKKSGKEYTFGVEYSLPFLTGVSVAFEATMELDGVKAAFANVAVKLTDAWDQVKDIVDTIAGKIWGKIKSWLKNKNKRQWFHMNKKMKHLAKE